MLKKILKEKYEKIPENKEEWEPSYFINKITDKLGPYIRGKIGGSPSWDFYYDGKIPSIPGGELFIHVTNLNFEIGWSARKKVSVTFSYLEKTEEEEDLEQVRQVIKEFGLEKVVE